MESEELEVEKGAWGYSREVEQLRIKLHGHQGWQYKPLEMMKQEIRERL